MAACSSLCASRGAQARGHHSLAQIVAEHGGRRLTGSADDAGELLRGAGLCAQHAGREAVGAGAYDDAQPDRPLVGTANIEDFRIRDAPAFGKLLQAMTLYGLVEVLQGAGPGFTRLVAPFRLTDSALELSDARAFSPSLGLTAKGRLDLMHRRSTCRAPSCRRISSTRCWETSRWLGKLFSPERGGGVFAASYSLRGPLADPNVSVNPLAALTPGFLRGLFGLF